jgi:hypothetical protein
MKKLTVDQKKVIINRIGVLDPKGKLVVLTPLTPNTSYSGGTVEYNKNSGITLHENISRLTDEEYIRAYIVVRLVAELRFYSIAGQRQTHREATVPQAPPANG